MGQSRALRHPQAYGAEIITFGRECSLAEAIGRALELASQTPDAFLPRQFSSADNILAHQSTTGPEIWWQLKFHGLAPQAFVAGVGTGVQALKRVCYTCCDPQECLASAPLVCTEAFPPPFCLRRR